MRRCAVALQQGFGSRVLPALAVTASLVLSGLGLSGCASVSQKFAESASQLPHVGLSPNAPARPAEQMAYPAVHDVPPPRTAVMLTDIEQHKLETDLLAARDQQQIAAGVPLASGKKKQPAKPEAAKSDSAKSDSARPAPAPAAGGRIY